MNATELLKQHRQTRVLQRLLQTRVRSDTLNWAAVTLILLTIGPWPTCSRAFAQPIPRLPVPTEKRLEEFGVPQHDGGPLRFVTWKSVFHVPVRNPEFADLMEQARRGDQVVPLTHRLFAPETAAIGHWHSAFYLDNYGTALFLAARFADDQIPVVLVHGIKGSPRDFADLVPRLQKAGYQPVYFLYPSGMALSAAARQLGERLREFVHRHHVDHLVVIGHSMGGLVSKGVLDGLDVGDELPSWRLFVAMSSPFGGIKSARYAERLPRHPPAWDDLAPNSAFMQKIKSTPFPLGLRFYLFFGARSSKRLVTALGNNDGVLTVDSMLATPVTAAASDVFGFYEDHMSILTAPLVFRRLESVLKAEVGTGLMSEVRSSGLSAPRYQLAVEQSPKGQPAQ